MYMQIFDESQLIRRVSVVNTGIRLLAVDSVITPVEAVRLTPVAGFAHAVQQAIIYKINIK